jgi:hypothetical protein
MKLDVPVMKVSFTAVNFLTWHFVVIPTGTCAKKNLLEEF